MLLIYHWFCFFSGLGGNCFAPCVSGFKSQVQGLSGSRVSGRSTASWRRSSATRSSPGTRRPRRTRPCLCPRPANQRTWTPSSWCRWSRRPSRPSWPASTTWLSLRAERAKSTPWWPRPTAWTTCVAWTPPGTPGSEGPRSHSRATRQDERRFSPPPPPYEHKSGQEKSWLFCTADSSEWIQAFLYELFGFTSVEFNLHRGLQFFYTRFFFSKGI